MARTLGRTAWGAFFSVALPFGAAGHRGRRQPRHDGMPERYRRRRFLRHQNPVGRHLYDLAGGRKSRRRGADRRGHADLRFRVPVDRADRAAPAILCSLGAQEPADQACSSQRLARDCWPFLSARSPCFSASSYPASFCLRFALHRFSDGLTVAFARAAGHSLLLSVLAAAIALLPRPHPCLWRTQCPQHSRALCDAHRRNGLCGARHGDGPRHPHSLRGLRQFASTA